MFYTVFSTNQNTCMQWQSELLAYSWQRSGQEGILVRLLATETPAHIPPLDHVTTIATSRYDTDPVPGDYYPAYNKPASLLEWLYRYEPEGTVLLIEPDCIFRRAVNQRAQPGAPVSQAWDNYPLVAPSTTHPYGLDHGFAFLGEYCSNTLETMPSVMIPTLIHTSDLKRICGRWLELTRLIRRRYRSPDGSPAWNSDVFAYMIAAAEYGLIHTPAQLGSNPPWPEHDSPDSLNSPLVHYCHPVRDENDATLFAKADYTPWTPVPEPQQASTGIGRDILAIINRFIAQRDGGLPVIPPSLMPQHRKDVRHAQVDGQHLLMSRDGRDQLWLSGDEWAIWQQCDGQTPAVDMGDAKQVQHVVNRLSDHRLLDRWFF